MTNISATPAKPTPPGLSGSDRVQLDELRERRDELSPSGSKTAAMLVIGGLVGAPMGAAAGAALKAVTADVNAPTVRLGRAAVLGAVLGGIGGAAALLGLNHLHDSRKLGEVNHKLDLMTGAADVRP